MGIDTVLGGLKFTMRRYDRSRRKPVPWGQKIEPTAKSLENTDFTLASGVNLSRRSEASIRAFGPRTYRPPVALTVPR